MLLSAATVFSLLSHSLNAQTTAGLQLWLKPDGLTNTVNLSKVSYWTNSIGTANAATNGIAANQPTFITNALNGYPVARFLDDGSSATGNTNLNWLVSPLPLSANSNSFTAVIVFESQITGARDTLIQQLGNGNTIFYVQTNGVANLNPNIDSFASGKELASPYSYPNRNWTILTMVQDAVAGTVAIYQNGFPLASTTIGTGNTLANSGWLFGCNKNKTTHGLNGDIAEVMIYSTALNPSARGATEIYLANKYGFVVLTDNFNTPNTSDLNADLASRQSGSAAPTPYYWNTATINNNEVRLVVSLTPPATFASEVFAPQINFATNESGSFKLSYDITSLAGVGDPQQTWAGVVIRSAYPFSNPIQPDGFNSIILSTGGHVDFINGQNVGGTLVGSGPPPYHIELIVNNNVLTYIMNYTNVLGVYTLPCPLANNVSLSAGSHVAAVITYDNFAFTTTPIAPNILPNFPSSLKLLDTFNTADTSDLNANLALRQTGSAATVLWDTAASSSVLSIAGNTLFMTNMPGGLATAAASPRVDFRQLEHLNSFRLRFKVAGANTFDSNESWVGVRFRDSSEARFVASADGGGTGINLFTGDGRWTLFQSVLGPTNVVTFPASGTVPVAASYDFEIEVRTNVMRMKVNGRPLLFGCGTETYDLPASQAANFVTLQCLASSAATDAYAQFDDFQFESLDPGFTVAAPTIINPSYANPAFKFSLNSVTPIFYAVDTKSNLLSATWNYLGGVVGNGGTVSYTNNAATNSPGFYRVRIP